MNQEPKRSFLRWIITGPIFVLFRWKIAGPIAGLIVVVVLLAVVALLLPLISPANEAAARLQSAYNLKQLGLALLDYHEANGHVPAAVNYGPDGKTPHSWRVALLPFLGEKELYDQYRFDEPWDSVHNKGLIAMIPTVFQNPNDDRPADNSCYLALVGTGTMFPPDGKPVLFEDIIDGRGNAIALVEAVRDVPWTKPGDILYAEEKPLPEMGGFHPGVFQATMDDGSVVKIKNDIAEEILRNLITIADGNEIPADW